MRGVTRAKATGKAYMKWVKGNSKARKAVRATNREGMKGTGKAYMKWVTDNAEARAAKRATNRAGMRGTGKAYMKWSKDNAVARGEKRATNRKLGKNFIRASRGQKVEEAMDIVKRSRENRAEFKQKVVSKLQANRAEYKGRKARFKKQLMNPKALRAQSKKNVKATRMAYKDWRTAKKAARKAGRNVYKVGLQHNEEREELMVAIVETLLAD